MNKIAAAFGISAFLLGAVGCANDDGTPDVADLPPAVVAQLDPSLEVLVINPKAWHNEGRNEIDDATGTRSNGPDESFDRSWEGGTAGTVASLPDEGTQPVASGDENKIKLNPADVAGTSSATVGMEPPRNRRPTVKDPFSSAGSSFQPPQNRRPTVADPFRKGNELAVSGTRVNEWKDVSDRLIARHRPSAPTYNGDTGTVAGSSVSAESPNPTNPDFDPCTCEGSTCVQDWIAENIGCGVCVVLTCGDNYYPHSCQTCQ